MYRDWPDELTEFESFLEQMGLVYQWSQAHMRYRDVHWADDKLKVKAVSDVVWWIEIAHVAWPDKWYSVETIRDFLQGQIIASAMTIKESVSFVESNWAAIVGAFDPECTSTTHAALQVVADEKARRRFPRERWYSPLTGHCGDSFIDLSAEYDEETHD